MIHRLLENKFYHLGFMVLTIVGVFTYVWIGMKLTAPKIVLPRSVSSFHLLSHGQYLPASRSFESQPFLTNEIIRSLVAFDSSIRLIGGLRHQVTVIVNLDDPARYLVTESRVELGKQWAESPGQIEKALTKSWVFQFARTDISSSLLRTEVASDLLWAMLNGGMKSQELQFPEVTHWLLNASSFASHCDSKWLSPELSGLCLSRDATTSDGIQSIGFRPLLDAMVWNSFKELSLYDRIGFIRAWTVWVTTQPPQPELPTPESLDDWRAWLRGEYASMIPRETGTQSHGPPSRVDREITRNLTAAGLAGAKSFDINYLFWSKNARFPDSRGLAQLIARGNEAIWKTPVTALTLTQDGWYSLPGRARLPSAGTEFFDFKEMVLEACAAPDMRSLVTEPIQSDRILYVRNCNEPWQAQYSPLITIGIKGFAAANPKTVFAQLQKPSIEIALRNGLLPNDHLLQDLLEKSDELNSVSPHIGLQEAKWRKDINAYQVLGAVEAVEWYRRTKDL